ncbi:MAG TPA: hypothetical protein VHD36_16720 [Pirellulales bacterium]|nr:hypothetical protein [Pirellulales bacterium]
MKHSLILLPPEMIQTPEGVSLYRLSFVGGPLDGAAIDSSDLPEPCLELASGPANCATRSGLVVLPRQARYRLQSVRLVNCATPVVACGYEYCGTISAPASRYSPWWKRCWHAAWDWLEPHPAPHFTRMP